MKGKKIDSEFVTNFIEKCVSSNIFSTEEILHSAKSEISDIDNKIKEVENLKKIRSKLLDVVLTFENKTIPSKLQDYKILQLFNIKNKNICKFICDKIKDNPIELDELLKQAYSINDINFTIKQLIEHKVICKTGKYILQADMYKPYVINVMREV